MKQRELSIFRIIGVLVMITLVCGLIIGCGNATKQDTVIKIGTTSDEPKVWEAVEKKLAKENIKIKVVNFANGANPNQALADGEVELNAFQHYSYFNKNKSDLHLDLTAIGDTIIVPLNLYSKKVTSLDQLNEGAKIAIPNDVVNLGRSLHVLENAGLIKLKAGVGLTPGLKDIAENPRNIKFVQLVSAQIPRSLNDVDAAIINMGYAVTAGLNPNDDVLFKDIIDLNDPNQQPYINIIAARTADKDNVLYKKVVQAYQSEEIAKVIEQVYKGAAIPAWKK